MKFQYFKGENKTVKSLTQINQVLKIGGKSVMVDSAYLPLIESASNGDIIAMAELAEAFRDGTKNLVKNYNLAKYYAILMLENAKSNIGLTVEAYANLSYLERTFGNYKEAISYAKKGIELMHNELPYSKWRTSLYVNIYKSLKELESIEE